LFSCQNKREKNVSLEKNIWANCNNATNLNVNDSSGNLIGIISAVNDSSGEFTIKEKSGKNVKFQYTDSLMMHIDKKLLVNGKCVQVLYTTDIITEEGEEINRYYLALDVKFY